MKLLLDMNLSPAWVPRLQAAGWETWHWSAVGDASATDSLGPSIVQIRGQDLSPTTLAETLIRVLRSHVGALAEGAIVTLDLRTARVRTLPLS